MRFIIMALAALALIGCDERKQLNDTEVAATDSVRQNLEVTEAYLQGKATAGGADATETKAVADIVGSQAETLETVIQPEELRDEQRGAPTVDLAALKADPTAAAAATVEADAQVREEVKESQSVLAQVAGWAGWGTLGAVGLSLLLTVQRVAAPQLSPILSDPVIKRIPYVGKLLTRAEDGEAALATAKGVIQDSVVGRAAISTLWSKLDPDTKALLLPYAAEIAGTEGATLDDLFAGAAKASAVDRGESVAAKALLDSVRDTMPTAGGKPVAPS